MSNETGTVTGELGLGGGGGGDTAASSAELQTERAAAAPVAVSNIQFFKPGQDEHSGNYPLAVWEPKGNLVLQDGVPNLDEQDVPLPGGTSIFRSSLSSLRDSAARDERIDIVPVATPERFRFIDCPRFVSNDILEIWESAELPLERYAAVSHVWRSLEPEPDEKLTSRGEFLVECEDRNDGGPISIDVLHYTCLACLHVGIRLLWLDRLCILQTRTPEGKKDKRWQIVRMYDVYKGCGICFVLPGGLRRFPIKEEETEWLERAWTFQEVMVAPVVKVLYTEYKGDPVESFVYSMHIEEYFKVQQKIYGDARDGSQDRRRQFTEALEHRQQYREPTVEHIARFRDVFQHVQWRVSARPVDVVFSVMGLLGVRLDVAQFNENDRLKATIAMAQTLLLKDDSLNTCVDIPLWRRLSRSTLESARLSDLSTREYMMNTPSRVNLQDLEKELDPRSLRRFQFATLKGLGPIEQEDVDAKDLESVNFKGVVMSAGSRDIALRAYLAPMVDLSLRSRRRADRVLKTIPEELLHKALEAKDDEKVHFERPEKITMELCRSLYPNISGVVTPSSPPSKYVFGWNVESALWVRLGRHTWARSDAESNAPPEKIGSTPVPIITFYKFQISS